MEGEEFMAYTVASHQGGNSGVLASKGQKTLSFFPSKKELLRGFRYMDAVSAHLFKSLFLFLTLKAKMATRKSNKCVLFIFISKIKACDIQQVPVALKSGLQSALRCPST